MALSDYANRRYDFLALQNISRERETRLGLELFDSDGRGQICVGVQKLAQRWLLEFLTELGSMPGLPARGCNFMTLVRQGRLRSQSSVVSAFNFAAYDVRVALATEEDDTWPNDERISDAVLLSVAFLPGYANLRVNIVSRAGTTRAIILPVATLPQTIN
jgi:hypothetical protein